MYECTPYSIVLGQSCTLLECGCARDCLRSSGDAATRAQPRRNTPALTQHTPSLLLIDIATFLMDIFYYLLKLHNPGRTNKTRDLSSFLTSDQACDRAGIV